VRFQPSQRREAEKQQPAAAATVAFKLSIYHWAFAVPPALCPPVPSTLKSGEGARAPPGYMAPAPLRNSKLSKNSRSELGEDVVHFPKLHIEKKTSHVKLC